MLHQNTRNLLISLFKGIEFEMECPISLSQCISAIENAPDSVLPKRNPSPTGIYPIDDNAYGFSLELLNKRTLVVLKGRIDSKRKDAIHLKAQAKVHGTFWLWVMYTLVVMVVTSKLLLISLLSNLLKRFRNP